MRRKCTCKQRTCLSTPALPERLLCSMFRKNDEFMSGLGLRYEPSVIVADEWQASASKLTVGQRMIPHVFICAADARPVNIQDRLPADARFKVLVFVGDITDSDTAARVRILADSLVAPAHFLKRYGHGGDNTVFDILCISASSKDAVDYTGGYSLTPNALRL